MSMSWCRSRWLYDEHHKSEQYPPCPNLCFMVRAPVCVWGGGGCHFHEATRNTLGNG